MTAEAAPTRRTLSPEARGWLVAAAAACFVGFLAATAFQPELAAGTGQGAQALSRSPVGFAGLVRLLRADGVPVTLNRSREPRGRVASDALLVLTPTPATPEAEIRRMAAGRRVLLIPSKWIVAPAPDGSRRVASEGRLPTRVAAAQAGAVLAEGRGAGAEISEDGAAPRPLVAKAPAAWRDPRWRPIALRPIAGLRTVSGPGVQPVLVDARERVLVAIAPKGVSYAVADPDLLDNHALADVNGARAAVDLVKDLADGGPVVFDLTLPGVAGERSALRSAFSPPLLPATVAFLLLAAMLGLMARERFGALRRPGRAYAFGKRALVDTSASLLAVAGREPRLAGRYAEIARADAVRAVGLPADGERSQVDAELDRIATARGAGPWSALAREAEAPGARATLVALARRIHHWRMEMTLGRG